VSNNLGFSDTSIILYVILVIFSIIFLAVLNFIENKNTKELRKKLEYQNQSENNIKYVFERYIKRKDK
jgi:cell division protein FtsL